MTGRVGVIEAHPFLGQPINVGGFMEGTAVAAHVGPTQIINQKEDDVGWLGSNLSRRKQPEKQGEEKCGEGSLHCPVKVLNRD